MYLTMPLLILPPGRENLIKSFRRISVIEDGAYGRLGLGGETWNPGCFNHTGLYLGVSTLGRR